MLESTYLINKHHRTTHQIHQDHLVVAIGDIFLVQRTHPTFAITIIFIMAPHSLDLEDDMTAVEEIHTKESKTGDDMMTTASDHMPKICITGLQGRIS